MGKVRSSSARVSRPGARFHTKRTPDGGLTPEVRRHIARVGRVIYASNQAHASVFIFFVHVSMRDSHKSAENLWHALPSDKMQRDFAEKYISENLFVKGPIRRAFIWSLRCLNELSTHRNDFAHADMWYHYSEADGSSGLVPGWATKPATKARFSQRPFEDRWKDLCGDLFALANYIDTLAVAAFMQHTWPLSKRPRLKLVRSTSAALQKQKGQAKKDVRDRQRKSSKS